MKRYEKPVSTDARATHYAAQASAAAAGKAFGKAFSSAASARGPELKVEIPSAFVVK